VENREAFVKMMSDNGVVASEVHKRNDLHTYLNDFPTKLPNLNLFYSKMVHIPCGWWVTDKDREKIVNLIKKGW